jgi:hypothetical protein
MKKLIPLLLLLFTMNVGAQQVKFTGEVNDPELLELIKDFHQSARYAKVENIAQLDSVRNILFVKSDLNMLGRFSEDGETIYLNEELKPFRHLTRIIFFRQIGKLYGLQLNKKRHAIMNDHWSIDIRHEWYAEHLSKQSWHDAHFFEALAKKAPIKVRL